MRACHCKTNKAQTLYNTDSLVCSLGKRGFHLVTLLILLNLVVNSAGTGFLSGHADGSIVRWYVAEDQNARNQGKVVVHSIPPYAMAWTAQHITVAGPDKKVVFYTMDGMMAQQFDIEFVEQGKYSKSSLPRTVIGSTYIPKVPVKLTKASTS